MKLQILLTIVLLFAFIGQVVGSPQRPDHDYCDGAYECYAIDEKGNTLEFNPYE